MERASGVDKTEIERRLICAVGHMVVKDRHLMENDGSERSIIHRVGVYLEGAFPPGWDVDCEYNLDGMTPNDPKAFMLPSAEPPHGDTERLVTPDLIVHKRGSSAPGANILAVEAKKLHTGRDWLTEIEDDFDRLRVLRDRRGYAVVAFLLLQTRRKRSTRSIGALLAFGTRDAEPFTVPFGEDDPPSLPREDWFQRGRTS
jgi:hypothetical protein